MSDEDFWVGAARRVAFRRNIALCVDAFVSKGLWVTGFAALAILVFRYRGMGTNAAWLGWGAALALVFAGCAVVAMRRPFTLAESLARLDEVGKLHNRLISAFAGVGQWPQPISGVDDPVQWNWSRLCVPILLGAFLLGVASLVNPPRFSGSTRPSEEPIAWTHMEAWLKTLDQAKLVDQPALEKLKEQMEDLRQQPDKDWYSQSSLEAGDALQQKTADSLRNLEDNLQKSAELMTQAQQASGMSVSQLQDLSAALKDAAQGMVSGNLPLNHELAGKLANFDPSSLKSMSQQQMEALRQRMEDGAKVCSSCVGPHIVKGKGPARGSTPTGHGGGGGPAPLALDDSAENLHTQRLEGASNQDPSRAMPGEVIAIAKGKHDVKEKTPGGIVDGGETSFAGQGGDAIWRDSLTPDERQVLQKYFK